MVDLTSEAPQLPGGDPIANLATLVATMSRLLGGISALPLLTSANLGLAEWVTLSVLANKDGISNKVLAKQLGVSGQRANQIKDSLSKSKYVTSTQSTSDSRQNVICITANGREQLNSVNSQLLPLLNTALSGNERSLVSANRVLRKVMKIVSSGNTAKVEKRQKRKRDKTGAAG